VNSGMAKKINDVGSFQIQLHKKLTETLRQGPVSLKIFANTNEALKPFISNNLYLVIK
jgi:hypothetical protein